MRETPPHPFLTSVLAFVLYTRFLPSSINTQRTDWTFLRLATKKMCLPLLPVMWSACVSVYLFITVCPTDWRQRNAWKIREKGKDAINRRASHRWPCYESSTRIFCMTGSSPTRRSTAGASGRKNVHSVVYVLFGGSLLSVKRHHDYRRASFGQTDYETELWVVLIVTLFVQRHRSGFLVGRRRKRLVQLWRSSERTCINDTRRTRRIGFTDGGQRQRRNGGDERTERSKRCRSRTGQLSKMADRSRDGTTRTRPVLARLWSGATHWGAGLTGCYSNSRPEDGTRSEGHVVPCVGREGFESTVDHHAHTGRHHVQPRGGLYVLQSDTGSHQRSWSDRLGLNTC